MHKVTDDPLKTYVQSPQIYTPHQPLVFMIPGMLKGQLSADFILVV